MGLYIYIYIMEKKMEAVLLYYIMIGYILRAGKFGG